MSTPEVAVVVPAYQSASFIGEAIDSVRAQTFANWELVVVDDGSEDATAASAEAVSDPRIRVLRLPHSGLPAVARNAGIAAATAPLIAFLDADDAWFPEKLEKQLRVLAQRPEVGLVHAQAVDADDSEDVISIEPPPPAETFDRLLEENFIVNSSVVLRRVLLDRHGLLDTTSELQGSEDYELWLRLARHTVFAMVAEPLVRYRRHSGGLSADRARMGISGLTARTKAVEQAGDSKRTPRYFRNLGIARCLAGARGSGRRELGRAVLGDPRDLLAWKWLLLAVLGSDLVGRLRRLARSGSPRPR